MQQLSQGVAGQCQHWPPLIAQHVREPYVSGGEEKVGSPGLPVQSLVIDILVGRVELYWQVDKGELLVAERLAHISGDITSQLFSLDQTFECGRSLRTCWRRRQGTLLSQPYPDRE